MFWITVFPQNGKDGINHPLLLELPCLRIKPKTQGQQRKTWYPIKGSRSSKPIPYQAVLTYLAHPYMELYSPPHPTPDFQSIFLLFDVFIVNSGAHREDNLFLWRRRVSYFPSNLLAFSQRAQEAVSFIYNPRFWLTLKLFHSCSSLSRPTRNVPCDICAGPFKLALQGRNPKGFLYTQKRHLVIYQLEGLLPFATCGQAHV